jgi:hypothetical protein
MTSGHSRRASRVGLDTEGLGRVTGGDRHRGIRQDLHDNDRLSAQSGIFLLFARRKESVEIEEQPLHRSVGR